MDFRIFVFFQPGFEKIAAAVSAVFAREFCDFGGVGFF